MLNACYEKCVSISYFSVFFYDVQTKVLEIIKEATDQDIISKRGPLGIVVASVYIASISCGELSTQFEISEVTGITEVTIRNRYKEIVEKLDILDLSPKFLDI